MHRCRPATLPPQHWNITIKLVIKFMNCFEWRHPSHLKIAWNCLCVTTTLPVSLKNNIVFMRCSTVLLCQPSCVNWHMSRNNSTLVNLGSVRTYLHDLLC
jgi:hypothetical protein